LGCSIIPLMECTFWLVRLVAFGVVSVFSIEFRTHRFQFFFNKECVSSYISNSIGTHRSAPCIASILSLIKIKEWIGAEGA
jgi:hypothetical protein